MRTDNEFLTKDLQTWAQLNGIEILPCIPHKHHQIGEVERFFRVLEDSFVKLRYEKPHITEEFWGFMLHNTIFKENITCTMTDYISPYEKWNGIKVDLPVTPMLPFGTVVMAHVPLDIQRTLGARAVKTYCIGTSIVHREGLLLYNPETHRVTVRRTYKAISPHDNVITPNEYETFENEHDSDDNVDIEELVNPDTSISDIIPPHDENIQSPEIEDELSNYTFLKDTYHIDRKKIYKVTRVYVYEETNDIVINRREILPNGKLKKKTSSDNEPYHVKDILLL